MTQLKAYFIALGGDLGSLLNNSSSIFDEIIQANFNTHLELTLLSNPELISKYPHYRDVMNGFMERMGIANHSLITQETVLLDLTLRYPSSNDDHQLMATPLKSIPKP